MVSSHSPFITIEIRNSNPICRINLIHFVLGMCSYIDINNFIKFANVLRISLLSFFAQTIAIDKKIFAMLTKNNCYCGILKLFLMKKRTAAATTN